MENVNNMHNKHGMTGVQCFKNRFNYKSKMTIEDIQIICRQFPGVTEDIKWEYDLVFSVGNKMFCVVGVDQTPATASFKVTEDEFDEMSTRRYFKPAPYVTKYKWVFIEDISKMKKSDWKTYLKQSYDLVKEKLPVKIKKQLGLN